MTGASGIKLVRMSEDHLENTYRWLSESERLREQVDCLLPPTREGNVRHWRAHWNDPTREDFAILDAAGVHVGNCGLRAIELQRRKAELWIYLGSSRGKGIGTEVVRLLLNKAFEQLGLNRVYLRVVAVNEEALRFYKAIGFSVEGFAREDARIAGRFVGSYWMSMLASEYSALYGGAGRPR